MEQVLYTDHNRWSKRLRLIKISELQDGNHCSSKDANGISNWAEILLPTVTPVTWTSEDVESTGKQGQETKQKQFKITEGDPVAPITNADQPAKLLTLQLANQQMQLELPAMKDGKQVVL